MNIVTAITKSKVRQLKEPNCWAFTVHTQELSRDQFDRLIELDDYCVMMLSDEGITKAQEEAVKDIEIKEEVKMSKSQEVRFQLKLLYELDDKGFKSFEEYYSNQMDVWIGKLKDLVKSERM